MYIGAFLLKQIFQIAKERIFLKNIFYSYSQVWQKPYALLKFYR